MEAMEERRKALPGWELQHYGLLVQILVHVHRYFREQMAENTVDAAAFSGIIDAVEYMMEHWSEEINMDELIGRSQLKKTWFYTKFKEVTGLTPLAFTVRLRLQYASRQLRGTNESITDIALTCGFGSSSYFNKVFRDFRGMTPGEYRKQ
ncbi:AraC family transcriptional regulator, partial [Paenibacillus sepulcri]|nr:AraC family transcriptional regulator [Paenibacillus sepulcri]